MLPLRKALHASDTLQKEYTDKEILDAEKRKESRPDHGLRNQISMFRQIACTRLKAYFVILEDSGTVKDALARQEKVRISEREPFRKL